MTDGNDYDVDGEVGVPADEGESWDEVARRLRADGMGGVGLADAFWRKQHRRAYRDSERQDCADYVPVDPFTPYDEQPDHRGVVVVRV